MKEKYFPREIEQKWQRRWAEQKTFEVKEDSARPKFYCLEMLAYTSGRAHIGHLRNYAIGDVVAWYKRLRGLNVLHPFGWDSRYYCAVPESLVDSTAELLVKQP